MFTFRTMSKKLVQSTRKTCRTFLSSRSLQDFILILPKFCLDETKNKSEFWKYLDKTIYFYFNHILISCRYLKKGGVLEFALFGRLIWQHYAMIKSGHAHVCTLHIKCPLHPALHFQQSRFNLQFKNMRACSRNALKNTVKNITLRNLVLKNTADCCISACPDHL